jgi:hypothetical protein
MGPCVRRDDEEGCLLSLVVARLDRAIQYAAAYRSIADASGILDHPPQCAIAHKAGDDDRVFVF